MSGRGRRPRKGTAGATYAIGRAIYLPTARVDDRSGGGGGEMAGPGWVNRFEEGDSRGADGRATVE